MRRMMYDEDDKEIGRIMRKMMRMMRRMMRMASGYQA